MASEQSKAPAGATQEHIQPHPIVPYPPQQYNGHYPPPHPGAYPPPYFTYGPMPDGSHDPNMPNGAPPGAPYMMAFPHPPPGMVIAYPAPPPGQVGYPPFPPGMPVAPPPPRPKRKQVKMACTNCASACKRCDEARPCERCVKYGIADTCRDGVRKERKKGIKRGPYKRKNRVASGDQPGEYSTSPSAEDPVVPPAPYPVPPEGYYSYYYPPGYMQPPPDGQHPEGVQNGNGMPPHPYYPVHPMYSPFPPYPGAGPMSYAPSPAAQAPVTSAPQATNGKADEPAGSSEGTGETGNATNATTTPTPTTKTKKRPRGQPTEGATKSRKTKATTTAHQGDGDACGKDQLLGGPGDVGPAYNSPESRLIAPV